MIKKKKNSLRDKIQLIMGLTFPILILAGLAYPLLGLLVIGMMLTFLSLAIFKGRFWCGWLCPRGSFLEKYLTFISLKKRIPNILKTKPFRLFVIITFMLLFAIQLWFTQGDLNQIGALFIRLCIISSLIAIPLGIIFKPRTWCSFCPMGILQGILGLNKNLLKIKDSCKNCNVCIKACPIQTNISLYIPLRQKK